MPKRVHALLFLTVTPAPAMLMSVANPWKGVPAARKEGVITPGVAGPTMGT